MRQSEPHCQSLTCKRRPNRMSKIAIQARTGSSLGGHRHGQVNVSGHCKLRSLLGKLCHPEPDWLQHRCRPPRKVCSDSERRRHSGRSCCTIFHCTRKPARSKPCGGIREPIQKNVLGRAVPGRQGSLVEPMVAVVVVLGLASVAFRPAPEKFSPALTLVRAIRVPVSMPFGSPLALLASCCGLDREAA